MVFYCPYFSINEFLLTLIMSFFHNVLFFVLIGVLIINAVIHYWNKYNLYEYLGSIPQLLKLNKVAKELLKYELFNELNREVSNSIKTIDKVRNRMSFLNYKLKSNWQRSSICSHHRDVQNTFFIRTPSFI